MLKPLLLVGLILQAAPAVHAADTLELSADHLRKLGQQLALGAGASQWQQLWRKARDQGHLHAHPTLAHFTVAHAQLPSLARETLALADHVTPFDRSKALYRRDFSPTVIGQRDDKALSRLCLEVDWRALPRNMADAPQAYLAGANLSRIYPCD